MNELMERIEVLMNEGIVIDTLSHGPLPWDEELVKANDEMLDKDVSAWEIVPELVLKFAHKLVNDDEYYQLYKDAWEQSNVNCVSWTIGPLHSKPYSFEGVFHNYAVMSYILDHRSDFLVKVLKADDIERVVKENKRGIILNFQSMQHIGEDIDLVELYYMMGVRIMQLTYNTKNLVGTGCTARRDRGLTDFGKQVVEKINELGAIVDVSHCGMQTSVDAVQYSKDPIIASHTFSKELYDHDRGKTDDLLKAIAGKKGYIGILAVAGFLTQNSKTTIDDWLNHVDY
ncbi:MAG: hypothetical protein GF383_05575, partial [Candidatus Lokiarchaeota archaeon]|nr:hypothetical protein [Candidatus Lokiarchaeota archaeon]MBD3339397.1 hypothetical protein [Candidatus Lokiarchaeota archaeon]